MSFPGTFHMGGDNHIKAVSRFYSNKRALQEEINKGISIDAVRWDARRLPLNEACVDVIVSDLVRYISFYFLNYHHNEGFFPIISVGPNPDIVFVFVAALWNSAG